MLYYFTLMINENKIEFADRLKQLCKQKENLQGDLTKLIEVERDDKKR